MCDAASARILQNRRMKHLPSSACPGAAHPFMAHENNPVKGNDGTRRGFVALLLACALAGPLANAFAQQPAPADNAALAPPWAPRTGDGWVDDALVDMGPYAARHREAFVDELVRYQDAPRALVEEALAAGTRPGDVYFACAAAQALGRPCRELLETGAAADGWAGRLRSVDAEAAAAARARVRLGITASYTRWARPLPPERSPGRGRGG